LICHGPISMTQWYVYVVLEIVDVNLNGASEHRTDGWDRSYCEDLGEDIEESI